MIASLSTAANKYIVLDGLLVADRELHVGSASSEVPTPDLHGEGLNCWPVALHKRVQRDSVHPFADRFRQVGEPASVDSCENRVLHRRVRGCRYQTPHEDSEVFLGSL